MQDRVPLYPGRVKMTPVAGQENIFDMVRADEPTQEGTPLNKATLLKDATAAILGLPNTAVPDDAFLALALPAGKYAISLTLKSPGGRPMSGISLSGIVTAAGSAVVTDENGVGFGFSTSSPTTITADISAFLDLTGTASVTLTPKEKIVNEAEIVCKRGSATKATFSASKTVKFSPDVSEYDASAIGGGENGGAATAPSMYREPQIGGNGGRAGGVLNLAKQKYVHPDSIMLTVGAVGGVSKIGENITPVGATGGKGATRRYSGRFIYTAATVGEDTSGFLYPPTEVGGAGGGGGVTDNDDPTTGEAKRGGTPGGGGPNINNNAKNRDGTKRGAGGAGESIYYNSDEDLTLYQAGKGVAGLVGIMWRYK